VVVRAYWCRTVGHRDDEAIDKRIDGSMVTETVVEATRSITSLDDVPAHRTSDRLPVMLEVDAELVAAR
jgi:hypothetical protein